MLKGRILRIEKTSIHDGEGLRTVIFFKGCPLRCKWCSTPESQSLDISNEYGKEWTTREVINEIQKDEIFFFHSGGGVTISGGEVLLQSDFAREILKETQELGIPTAIETSLYSKYNEIEKLLPFLNAMYIDFKVCDEREHIQYTKVSNQIMKENLYKIGQQFKGTIHIRIPIVPGINMTAENMKQTACFLKKVDHISSVELLPYHRLGVDTYRKLGIIYELKDTPVPTAQEMKKMKSIFNQYWR